MKTHAPLLLLALTVGCVTLPRPVDLPRRLDVNAGESQFHIRYESDDEDAARGIASILPTATTRLTRWGAFMGTVTIFVMPDHASLEHAIYREGYPWLRAWSRYDTIHLQSPRTWGAGGGTPEQILELLSHELTHSLMYQRSATTRDWITKGYPIWFREGMASVTSEQGYRRMTVEDLAAWVRGAASRDPLRDAEALYQSEPDVVYGASHRAFEFFLRRFGEGAVRAMLDDMHHGASFDWAFTRETHLSPETFDQQFLEMLRSSVHERH